MSKQAVSHAKEASGAPGPTSYTNLQNHHWIVFSLHSVAGDISSHVPAPCSSEGMQQASKRMLAVIRPPTVCARQSFTICAIPRQAPLTLPSLALTVYDTESARPHAEKYCPSHLSTCFSFILNLKSKTQKGLDILLWWEADVPAQGVDDQGTDLSWERLLDLPKRVNKDWMKICIRLVTRMRH